MLKIPKTVFLFMVLVALTLLGVEAYAELYQGIGPLDTLADLKKKFPNANFVKAKPAWAQESDVMYKITGVGISGTIVINFYDSRPTWRVRAQEATDEKLKELCERFANASDDDVMVGWVRWVPDTPFSIERLITKYGKPDVSGFTNDDYQPYKEWKQRGLFVRLTDDGKRVVGMEFTPTKKEEEEAMKKVGGVPPSAPQVQSEQKKRKK